MITELGRFFFKMTIAVAIASLIIVSVFNAYGIPVPDELLRYSSILGLITGRVDLQTLLNFAKNLGYAFSGVLLVNAVSAILRTGQINMSQAITLKAIAMYLAIWVPVADGVSIITATLARFFSIMMPGAAASGPVAVVTAMDAVIKFATVYYLASRVFNVPAE